MSALHYNAQMGHQAAVELLAATDGIVIDLGTDDCFGKSRFCGYF